MNSLVNEAVTGFHTLVDEQPTVTPPANFSLSLFNYDIKLLYDAIPLPDVPPLAAALYEPDGRTALNQVLAPTAIGITNLAQCQPLKS
jgi:hypothetical protein